ncbi:MAG: triose-phosphate isomerase [Flavobacteriales bacterium CG18_big_fil_WC_8_21_14_2_50_32_9]|nr:triose-phosphate isomerase [Flavobacteriales bacterium]PIQ16500.1 MAG: triose-phosphate isomerase [Flavobacteriales bacterium CG18_big_fil_WC_8_21_14_2_50_32_9]PJC62028.1 MAG: triose-phosphate isomerase [Flavobacteriales bacterium CG_4_9_14_0_2_um_filter_32_27]
MRKKIVAGNWKMNTSFEEAITLIEEIKKCTISNGLELIVNPPFVYCQPLAQSLKSSAIKLGAQNCSEHQSGAFTGEIAATMLQSIGVTYVIIGHSERRSLFNETDETIAKKINQAIHSNLQPIFCCGEQLSEREANNHFERVKTQLENGLFHLSETDFKKVIIAYEPVWAIGTGITATSDQAQEMHQFIRTLVSKHYTHEIAENCSILYGGSCNASNAKELFSKPDVDGGLIGGASLKAVDFIAIANSF